VVNSQAAQDTADRSLAHWSEEGRGEMEAFYALAQLDYRLLAEAADWPGLLGRLRQEAGRTLRLLDVACGSGKFPRALLTRGGLDEVAAIDYDLLDPSAFSLSEAAATLAPPFRKRASLETTLEDLDGSAGPWDVVWATHALYALKPSNLPAAVERFRAAVAPGGVAFLAQGSADGHYLRVYAAFLEGVRGGDGTQYVSSDDLIAELVAQGSTPQVRRLAYDHVVRASDTAVLEGYLQRCLFDDTISLDEMLGAPVLGPYLASCHDDAGGVYRFHQEVDCVVLASTPEAFPWTAAS